MPSLLETQNKSRKVKPIAWVVFIGGSPRDLSFTEICAGSDELLGDFATTREVKEGDKISYVRAVESKWQPERTRRLFIKGWPEPLYQKGDMAIFENERRFLVLRSERERDQYIKRRRVELETEGKVAEARRRAADQKYIEERDAEIAKIRGEP
jgi:hypothetical protein